MDDLFLDENNQPEYFGVKMGFLGMSSTLIPADVTTINHEQGFIEVSHPKSTVKEDIRVRKDVVNEEEVVEEDVRKEEVDIDDQTTGRGGRPGGTAGGRDNDDLEDETRRRNR